MSWAQDNRVLRKAPALVLAALTLVAAGCGGLRRRLRGPGSPEEQAIPWEAVVDLPDDTVVVRR